MAAGVNIYLNACLLPCVQRVYAEKLLDLLDPEKKYIKCVRVFPLAIWGYAVLLVSPASRPCVASA